MSYENLQLITKLTEECQKRGDTLDHALKLGLQWKAMSEVLSKAICEISRADTLEEAALLSIEALGSRINFEKTVADRIAQWEKENKEDKASYE